VAAPIILGIESSCDETAIALVRGDGAILAQALHSQRDHDIYGGVVPEIAARAHLQVIDSLLQRVFAEAALPMHAVDAIAATTGPGLIGGVLVGTMMGKSLALALHKPFIAVNHLEAHALVVRQAHAVSFPYLLLLVSGGHCQIVLVRGVGDFHVLGRTRDDAVGEAFDKCAKMLGLDFPGGPAIEREARAGNPNAYKFPRPMAGSDGCDMSFSGLKTAVRLSIEKGLASGQSLESLRPSIAASFQHAVVETLRDRMMRACALVGAIMGMPLVAAGGVAANAALRAMLQEVATDHAMPFVVAAPSLCTDNGVMIAWAGVERLRLGLVNDLSVEPRARWPLGELTAG
jgi:N6-L-threonylcarbamoyladenine synthase